MPSSPRNHIEFRCHNPESEAHVTHRVLIDGTELLIAEDGIDINTSGNEVTTVTLKVIPHRVSFR